MDSWFSARLLSANIAAGVSTPSIKSKTFRSPSAIIPAHTARFTAAITITQRGNKMNIVPLGHVVAASLLASMGTFIFIVAFSVMDTLTPYLLCKEIEREDNLE